MRDFRQRHALAAGVVAQQRGRTAQRERCRRRRLCLRQLQHRLDLRRQLVIQQQRPAAAKRPARLVARAAFGLPVRVQRGQEIAFGDGTAQIAGDAITVQPQALAAGDQQQVPAALCGARRRRFQQQRITLRRQAVQRQQIYIGRQGNSTQHRESGTRMGGDAMPPCERRRNAGSVIPAVQAPFPHQKKQAENQRIAMQTSG